MAKMGQVFDADRGLWVEADVAPELELQAQHTRPELGTNFREAHRAFLGLTPETGLDQQASDYLGRIRAGEFKTTGQDWFDPFTDNKLLGALSALAIPAGLAVAGVGGGAAAGSGAGAGAAGGAAGGGALMPAAQPLSAETLSSLGLTETAPGVFTNVGNASAFGSSLAFNPQTSAALGLPGPTGQPTLTGTTGGMIHTPVQMPAAPTGPGPGIGTGITAPAGGAGSAGGGGALAGAQPSFVDSVLAQLKANSLGLGIAGAGLAMQSKQTPLPNEEQINALGAEGAAVARELIGRYRTGELSPGQQASVNQQIQHAKNQITNYFANIGQADSTAHMQALAQVDQTALQLKQQMLDTMLNQGLQAIGVAQGPLNTVAQYQLGQDRQLADAFGRFAGAVGGMVGRQAGAPATTATYMPTTL